MKKQKLTILLSCALVGLLCFAAWTGFDAIKIAPQSHTASTYNIDSKNTSGTTTFSVTPAGVTALTDLTGTSIVDSTNITDITRSFSLQLGAGGVDGGNDVDDGSTPDMTTCDGIPCIVWADSSETTAVGWTFRLPSDFVSGLSVYALVSSNEASGSGTILDWAVFANLDDTAFDSAPFAQTAVECTSATLDASNEVLTLTSDATAEAAYVAGAFITLEFFNASTNDDDLELKGLEITYTATQ